MEYEIKDKVVLVTGGAIGIGAKIVEYFLDEGVKNVTFLDILEREGYYLENELNKKYGQGKAVFRVCDITNTVQLFEVYNIILDQYKSIDIVVNNAGIMNDSWTSFKKEIDLNVTALVTNTLKAMEVMREDKGGSGGVIINIASIAALGLSHFLPVYNATKAAVVNFSSSIGLPHYYTRTGVRVLSVCFGATDSSLLSKEKFGAVDDTTEEQLDYVLTSQIPRQKIDSAAKAVIDVCKVGTSGSTWLSIYDRPAKDISDVIKAGYDTFQQVVDPNFGSNS